MPGDDVGRQRRRRRLPVPPARIEPVAHVLLVEARLRTARARRCRPARTGWSRACRPRRRAAASPPANPNSSFVSATISPRAAAVVGDALVDRERELLEPLVETAPDEVDRLVGRHRQVVALGGLRGRREDRLRAAGPTRRARRAAARRRPRRVSRYWVHPLPLEVAARDALERHDVGAAHEERRAPPGSARRRTAPGTTRRSALTTWLPTRSAVRSNQWSERPVSTRPLSGIGSGSTTSKALMRSVATSSSASSPARVHVAHLAPRDQLPGRCAARRVTSPARTRRPAASRGARTSGPRLRRKRAGLEQARRARRRRAPRAPRDRR